MPAANLARRVGRRDGRDRVVGLGEQVVGGLERGEVGFEVRDHLLSLGSLQLADRLEPILHIFQEVFDHVAPAPRIGFEQAELVGCCASVSRGPGRGFERIEGV
jgi:hypothetical protein